MAATITVAASYTMARDTTLKADQAYPALADREGRGADPADAGGRLQMRISAPE